MPEVATVNLPRPIQTVRIVGTAVGADGRAPGHPDLPPPSAEHIEAAVQAERQRLQSELHQQKEQIGQLCRTVGALADGLQKVYTDTLAGQRAEIARLAVEIARKILVHKVGRGEYDIQAIVEEALKRSPTRQNIVVRLHPEDLPRCQQLQQENPETPFADLEFTADWSIGRGECLVETPKGIVKSFVEEHLEQIAEALAQVE
jgi:flagellar biosynthesis/type III secretory pathway protein FliH